MKKILVIDDSDTIRKLVKLSLSRFGYTVETAVNGREGLDKLNAVSPDLIICDINMPHLDGFGFLEALRKEEDFKDFKYVPVMVLTTESDEVLRTKGQLTGARAWLVKPFDPESLLETVEQLVA